MTGSEGAKVVAVASTTAAVPAAALSVDEVMLLVGMPLLAAWIGLAGIGLLEGLAFRRIMLNLAGTVMLGGVAGICAAAMIEALGVRGFPAMFVTLTVGMGTLTLARKLRSGKLLDTLLGMIGFQRGPTQYTDNDRLNQMLDDMDKGEGR